MRIKLTVVVVFGRSFTFSKKREELNKRKVATELDVKRQKYSTFVDLFRIHADRRRKLPNN